MKIKNLAIVTIILTGLAVSGCTGPSQEIPANPPVFSTITANSTPVPTEDVMDSEISTVESDITEMDALLADIDDMQDMNFTELDGIEF